MTNLMPSEDFLTFADPSPEEAERAGLPPWKLAVVDDDPAVHDGTQFALRDFRLNGRGITILSAHSAREGRELLARHPDTAVVLLDVVMESDDAGLRLARAIRDELRNDLVRIILRTGQPGQAPEHRVVVDYDINDYKAKTELTAEKLFTTLTAALRGYEQLKRLDETRIGLELIVSAAGELFDDRSLERLAEGVLMQLNALLALDCAGMLVMRDGDDSHPTILARSGSFAESEDHTGLDFAALFREAVRRGTPVFRDHHTMLYVKTGGGSEVLVVLDTTHELSETQASLVSVFSAKLAVAFDNARLYDHLRRANADLEDRVAERTRELIAANERLEAQGAQLKRVNAFKNEILGTIAHDLKNPLAVILGRAEMLSELAARPQDAPADVLIAQIGHIRAAARRLTRMVDISVADAMADALDISVRRRFIDVAAILASVAEANRSLAEAKGQTLYVAIRSVLPVMGDPDRLAEAIDNLMSNAIKYAPVHGRIEVRAAIEDGEARITVADSGPGLGAGDVARLFQRFQRLTAQPTGGESSTGLGLSIVRKIVDLHEGRIEVAEKGPLGGAAFTIALPLRARPGP